jgi:hypothetical protein
MRAVETLPVDHWNGPFDAAMGRHAVRELEAGRVLFLPSLDFKLSEAERRTLRAAASGERQSKNISYDSASGRCKGASLGEATAAQLAALLKRFGEQATALLVGLAPGYARGLEPARASFRPADVASRNLSWRKDDRRLHVDAFPSRPARGRRILRIFSNVDPDGAPRRWRIGEPLEEHAARFLPSVRPAPPAQAALLALLGLTRGRRSPYDQLMLALHDAAKRDARYQAGAPAEVFEFPAGSSWIVYTDFVPHAALSGRCALEQTFALDPGAMAEPDRAPLAILQRLTGRTLV